MNYALITGASKGIGKAIAEELAARKFNVLLIARSEEPLRENARQIGETYGVKADYFALDLSLPDAADKIFHWCRDKNYLVQILVNNAGYGLSGSFDKYTIEENINMMELNMIVPVRLSQLFLPSLLLQPRAYILNIASTAAYQAVPGLSLYAATKAFVLSFSRALHQELHQSNVSVTCISPGSTSTDFARRAQVGIRGLKAAEKVNMTPVAVARIAVNSMFAGKTEVITGAINKLGAFLAWLSPKVLVERTAMKIYQ